MPNVFYAWLQTSFEVKDKRGKSGMRFRNQYYRLEKSSYHEALMSIARMIPYLYDQRGETWTLRTLSEQEPPQPPLDLLTYLPNYEDRFYDSAHDYEYMVIERCRLLGLPLGSEENLYGAYVRNRDTGATSFACPHHEFVTHGQIEKALSKMQHDPRTGFIWHPILFPYTQKEGEPCVNLSYYVLSDPVLSFPIQFFEHNAYNRQIQWIADQEGLA